MTSYPPLTSAVHRPDAVMLPWREYVDAMVGLATLVVTKPSYANIERLAPHMSPDEIEKIYRRGLTERTYFAGPPLRVHGALQIFCIDRARIGNVYGEPTIYHAYVIRRPESFVNHPAIMRAAENVKFPWMEDAEDYACEHWPDEMIWDECKSVMAGYMVTPGPHCERVVEFIAWSAGQFPEMLAYDHEPVCEIIDDSLEEVSVWQPTCFEMSVGHLPFVANFCTLCGGGVAGNRCSFCDCVFNMPTISVQWPYALPRSAENALRIVDYEFKIEPVEARKAEHRKWAKPGYVPAIPTEFLALGKQYRSIDL